jgi:hypothetical protein
MPAAAPRRCFFAAIAGLKDAALSPPTPALPPSAFLILPLFSDYSLFADRLPLSRCSFSARPRFHSFRISAMTLFFQLIDIRHFICQPYYAIFISLYADISIRLISPPAFSRHSLRVSPLLPLFSDAVTRSDATAAVLMLLLNEATLLSQP